MLQQVLINGLISGSIYTLISLGFAIIYRTVRFFHFAHGVVYAGGAYLAYTLVVSFWSLVDSSGSLFLRWCIAGPAVIVCAGAVGVLIDRVVYRPLRKRKAPNLVFLIA